jgi:probable phosphoglycerate mutase
VRLNERGQQEAERLADDLTDVQIAAIYTSPQERASETAVPLAKRRGLTAHVSSELDEIDFGGWTGKSFESLAPDPAWRQWVDRRSEAQPPGGETIARAQRRVLDAIGRLSAAHARSTVALVTHGDLIKAVLAHYLGLSLDGLERFDVAPASVSVVFLGYDWAQVKLVNATGRVPHY